MKKFVSISVPLKFILKKMPSFPLSLCFETILDTNIKYQQTCKKQVLQVLQNQIFSDSPPKLSCFLPQFYLILPKFTQDYQSFPKFTKFSKFHKHFTKAYQILPLGKCPNFSRQKGFFLVFDFSNTEMIWRMEP